jgi:hypothetical protein
LGLANRQVSSVYSNGTSLFAGTFGNGLFISNNNGITWTQAKPANLNVQQIVGNGNCVFVGTLGEGVFMSLNNELNMYKVNKGLIDLNIISLSIKDNYLFIGTYGCSIWKRAINEIIASDK